MTYYFDHNIPVSVSRAIASIRTDVLFAGGPAAPPANAPDREWLQRAGDQDWIVLTRDKRIRSRPGERETFLAAGVRTFCFTASGNYTAWQMLELIVGSWQRIESVAEGRAGPYIYSVTQAGVRELQVRK